MRIQVLGCNQPFAPSAEDVITEPFGIPGRPPYVIHCGSVGWKKVSSKIRLLSEVKTVLNVQKTRHSWAKTQIIHSKQIKSEAMKFLYKEKKKVWILRFFRNFRLPWFCFAFEKGSRYMFMGKFDLIKLNSYILIFICDWNSDIEFENIVKWFQWFPVVSRGAFFKTFYT